MRFLTLAAMTAAALATLGAAPPAAQAPTAPPPSPQAVTAAPPAPLGPPRAYQGYTQPDIGATACRVMSPAQTVCTLPPMTAGRYLIEASGTSTAQGAGATQKIVIALGSQSCGVAERKPTAAAPWTAGPKTIKLQCEVEVLTDRPLQISALYGDAKAVKAPAGPTLTVKRLPWDGVLSSRAINPPQQ